MDEIQYIGEHLWPGQIGHFAILLGFVTAILATISYLLGSLREDHSEEEGRSWKQIGRIGFGIHGLSVVLIMSLIFYVMINKYYEYNYVFAHVNEDLPFQFIFSAFWEGQEGSFLLWMFWHVVLGTILIFTAKRWESSVMFGLSLIEVFIMSMILGVYIGFGDDPFRLGSNPLLLLRDTMDAPIFQNADYLSLFKWTGLNPLLQNYCMTIHPPTLFLGFASTSIPFCFALAGLLKKDHTGWIQPVMPWALFSAGLLGIGILMGGAWAYEALTFGGYWAWDPVENMSLVPWIILVAGIHTNLIAKNTNYSIRSTYIFYLLTFIMIVYSTFLTRSGVLGETSVHAFTEMGLEWQLVSFIVFPLVLSIILFARAWKSIPAPKKEEGSASKEFWMFIGSLVLLFSAVMITVSTSLPVYNKIMQWFDPAFEGRVINDPVEHYNKYQLWIAVFIGLMTGLVQYLRWKEMNWAKYARKYLIHVGASALVATVLTVLTATWIETFTWQYTTLLWCGLFAFSANLDYLITIAKGNIKLAGSATAHMGFGIMILGVIASGLNQFHISSNPFAQRGLIDEERLGKNIMLFKGMPMFMSGYRVTYLDDEFEGNNRVYTLNFQKMSEEGDIEKEFNLYPTALYDNKVTKVAAYNPSTKHYLGRDVFTHIATIPRVEADAEYAREREDSLKYRDYLLRDDRAVPVYDTVIVRDSQVVRTYFLEVEELFQDDRHDGYEAQDGDLAVGLRLKMQDERRDTTFTAEPMVVLRGNLLYTYPVQVQDLSLKVKVDEKVLDRYLVPENQLQYDTLVFKIGDQRALSKFDISFRSFNREPSHPSYRPAEGDISVGAILDITNRETGEKNSAEPVYVIRDRQPFNLKDVVDEMGLHIQFVGLDPVAETLSVAIAEHELDRSTFPVELAYSPRTDFVVLEAIVFPGINFFWMGSILMMSGLLISMGVRIGDRRRQARMA